MSFSHAVVDDVDAALKPARSPSGTMPSTCPGELVAAPYRQVDLFERPVVKVPASRRTSCALVGEPAQGVAPSAVRTRVMVASSLSSITCTPGRRDSYERAGCSTPVEGVVGVLDGYSSLPQA